MTGNTLGLTRTMVATIAALLAGADRAPAAERVATSGSSYCLEKPCPPDSSGGGKGPQFKTDATSGEGFGDRATGEFGSASTSVSNDSTSRFIGLVLHKSIALDLPRDVSDVLVGDPKIANAVLRSNRRAFIIGMGLGQTNVYFYDAKGQQIDGLNVNVADHVISERIPTREVLVVRGATENDKQMQVYECAPICALAENATPDKPPATYLVLPNVTSLR
jgi:Flp pilus assembly secretin CpaC